MLNRQLWLDGLCLYKYLCLLAVPASHLQTSRSSDLLLYCWAIWQRCFLHLCCCATQTPATAAAWDASQVCANLCMAKGSCRCCSVREIERGDRAVWGSTGSNQIGILHPGTLPVRYEYDTVLDESCSNQQVHMCTQWHPGL